MAALDWTNPVGGDALGVEHRLHSGGNGFRHAAVSADISAATAAVAIILCKTYS
jgi:hypothetical protein